MRARFLTGLVLLGLCAIAHANSPEDVLQNYVELIQTDDYDDIGSLFSADARKKVKQVFEEALAHEIDSGGYQLQLRTFDRKVSHQDVRDTSADTYLSLLMRRLVTSTRQQDVKMDRVEIVGRIDETADQAHLLVRIFMSQSETPFNNLQVFSFTRVNDRWALEIPTMIKQVLEMMHYSAKR